VESCDCLLRRRVALRRGCRAPSPTASLIHNLSVFSSAAAPDSAGSGRARYRRRSSITCLRSGRHFAQRCGTPAGKRRTGAPGDESPRGHPVICRGGLTAARLSGDRGSGRWRAKPAFRFTVPELRRRSTACHREPGEVNARRARQPAACASRAVLPRVRNRFGRRGRVPRRTTTLPSSDGRSTRNPAARSGR